jgi:NitT/TauT family transport system permease protein
MRERVKDWLYPAISLVVFFAAWEAAVVWFRVPEYLLPRPLIVAQTLWSGYASGLYWPHLFTTLYEVVVGYIIGCGSALLLGAAVAEWRSLERLIVPYVVALQSTPKVALAPLLIVWLGFGVESKIALVVLICFFPIFANSVAGFRSANPDMIDLLRVFNASRMHIFLNAKVPAAANSIFAGLQIAVVLALIGAVVGEFVTAKQGLGFLIQSSTLNFDVPTMFAAILTLAMLGILGTSLVRLAYRRLVFWEQGRGGTTTALAEGG